jgi:hypothetical protein
MFKVSFLFIQIQKARIATVCCFQLRQCSGHSAPCWFVWQASQASTALSSMKVETRAIYGPLNVSQQTIIVLNPSSSMPSLCWTGKCITWHFKTRHKEKKKKFIWWNQRNKWLQYSVFKWRLYIIMLLLFTYKHHLCNHIFIRIREKTQVKRE